MLLAPSEVLDRGLDYFRLTKRAKRWDLSRQEEEFHKHYGSSTIVIALVWVDLLEYSSLKTNEKNEKGFKQAMVAMHFLWAKPKNASILASAMDISVDNACGKPLWKWIERIASLKAVKIQPTDALTVDEVYAVSADGIDFKVWERKHALYNIDIKACSHKFRACAAKYLIALSMRQAKCLFVAGPYPGGVSDGDIMVESGLQDLIIQHNKVVMVDRGFHSDNPEHRETHAYPDEIDPPDLHNFKSRARLRQETFNRRLRCFSVLADTFTHGWDKHKIAFEAVLVTVQYQMDNGSPIFSV
jgi:hypothetical protein